MEKTAKYFTVGVFMTCAIFALVGFLIWLASPRDEENYAFYTVEFADSIDGLAEGADVQYKGVKVGKVIKTYLVKNSKSLVHVDIGIDKRTPVRAHTKVTLQTQGITGLVKMEMSTRDDDAEKPQKTAGGKYPLLQGHGSRLYQALEDLPVITAQVVDITKKVDSIITRNKGPIDRFASEGLAGFTAAAQDIKATSGSIRKLTDKISDNPSQLVFPSSPGGVEIPP